MHIPLGSALWDAIPQDYDASIPSWDGPNAQSVAAHNNPYSADASETLNPMFRLDSRHLVPFLHCEIEGNALQILLDNLILAVSAWIAATIALCWLGPIGALIAIGVGFLAFLLKWIWDKITGNDGTPDEPDVDWMDPENPNAPISDQAGDVVVAHGHWIMDTEHRQYFEIHPLRAYYLIARNSLGTEPVLANGNMDQEEFQHENYDPGEITGEIAERICGIVSKAEEEEPPRTVERTARQALAYGMVTKFAGGGANDPDRDQVD